MYIHENMDIDYISVQSNIKIKTHISNKIVKGQRNTGTSCNDNRGVHMGGFFAS